MFEIEVKEDTENVALFFKTFGPKADQAMARALRRAATSIKVRAGQEARKRYNIKATAVKKAAVVKFNRSDQSATAIFSSIRLPLANFEPSKRPRKAGRATPTLTVKVKATRKPVRTVFVAKMKSGHTGVFRRTGKKGRNGKPYLEAIEELTSVSIPQMVGNPEVRKYVQELALETFDKNFTHEMNYLIQKGGK